MTNGTHGNKGMGIPLAAMLMVSIIASSPIMHVGPQQATAETQSASVNIWTDKTSYTLGDNVVVSVSVKPVKPDTAITLFVLTADGITWAQEKIYPNGDGIAIFTFVLSNDVQTGTWSLVATYLDAIATTTFFYSYTQQGQQTSPPTNTIASITVWTEKSSYAPGDEVIVNIFVQPVSDKTVAYAILNPSGSAILAGKATPKQNGALGIAFLLRTDDPIGNWKVSVGYIDASSEARFSLTQTGTGSVSVPNPNPIMIKVSSDKASYTIGDRAVIRAEGQIPRGETVIIIVGPNGWTFLNQKFLANDKGIVEYRFDIIKDYPAGQWTIIASYKDSKAKATFSVSKVKVESAPGPQSSNDFLVYENPAYGIKIKYPANWHKEEEQGQYTRTVTFLSPPESASDKFPESVTVVVTNLPAPTSTDEFTKGFIEWAKVNIKDFKIVESTITAVASIPAQKIVFTGRGGGYYGDVDLKAIGIFMVKGKKGYQIAYTAENATYSAYLSTVQEMIDSFEIYSTVPKISEIKFLTYENSTYGIKIQYPADWEKVEQKQQFFHVTFYSPDSAAVASIYIEVLAPGTAIDAYTDAIIKQVKTLTDFKMDESSSATLAGYPAHKIVFTDRYDRNLMKEMAIWTIRDNKAYVIMYHAAMEQYSDYLPIIQKMIDSLQIKPVMLVNKISGQYVNSDLKYQIVFPEGWSGFEGSLYNKYRVTVGPGGINPPDHGNATAVMTILPIKLSEPLSETVRSIIFIIDTLELSPVSLTPASAQSCDTPVYLAITKLNDMKVLEVVKECQSVLNTIKTKMYFVVSEHVYIAIAFAANSDIAYKNNIAKFEESAKTFKTEKIIEPFSFEYDHLQGLSHGKQKVLAGGNSYNVAVTSNSTISDFVFSEENKQISFNVEGEGGTEGSARINVGKVLEGPYTVTMDRKTMDDFIVIEDRTVNETSIVLYYTHSKHEITITGTKLVPEVPIPEKGKQKEVAKEVKIRLNARQKGDTVLVTAKSFSLSKVDIYGLHLILNNGNVKSLYAHKGWNFGIDEKTNTVKLFTHENPIKPGKSIRFKIQIDSTQFSCSWVALDKDLNEVASGSMKARLAV